MRVYVNFLTGANIIWHNTRVQSLKQNLHQHHSTEKQAPNEELSVSTLCKKQQNILTN